MKTGNYQASIRAAIQALVLVLPSRLRWAGVPVGITSPTVPLMRSLLVEQLAMLLYERFYCYGRVMPLPSRIEVPREAMAQGRFVNQLMCANRAAERWETGCRPIGTKGEYLQVERAGLTVLLSPNDWREEGDRRDIAVRLPSGSLALSPGFYVVLVGELLAGAELLRFYWNVSPTGARSLVQEVTTKLPEVVDAFQLKVLVGLSRYGRADTGVLYLPQGRITEVAEVLREIHRAVRSHLRPNVPAFTHQIAPGLAIAEQPAGGESFGRHRCHLLGEALVIASEAGLRTTDQRLGVVATHFAKHGLSWDRPHLNPGSDRRYLLNFDTISGMQRTCTGVRGHSAFLELAVRIGDELVRSAIWDGLHCNWVGDLIGSPRAFGALGADLYAGTSGIAVLLAELFRATGQHTFRRTAAGAVAQACAGYPATERRLGKGLYAGWAGVALAAWRCAGLLHMPELLQGATAALRRLSRLASGGVTSDIIGGEAGAILALIAIGDDRCLRLATRFGTAILSVANRRGEQWSWSTTNPQGCRDMTGFSHGAAGIAAALLLLYDRTGRVEFREAAAGALRYERRYYDAAEKNWFDLREVRRRDKPTRFAVTWCHGAPGIALSRAVATRFPETVAQATDDLDAALDTTRTAIRAGLTGDPSLCLCHGLAGNAEILTLLGNAHDSALTIEVAQLGRARSARSWLPFAAAERLPGLMTGIAGVASFYLRLHDPSVPSPLWPFLMPPAPKQGN